MSEASDNAFLDKLKAMPGEELMGKGALLEIALRQREFIAILRARESTTRTKYAQSRKAFTEARSTNKIEVTPAMVAAGISRLSDLLEAQTSTAYIVTEVFKAMREAHGNSYADNCA